MHQAFIENAVKILKRDTRILGLAAGGSYITGGMDEFSDIDFVVAVDPAHTERVMDERHEIAGRLGKLLASFTGEHVGEPRLLICLYGPPLLHVDLKFVSTDDLPHRVEDPAILWERDGAISKAFASERAKYPLPDLQWIEDRFWVWIHYCAVKIGRGELFETIECVSFLRQTVMGPLVAIKDGRLPRGMRIIETDAPSYLPLLKETLACHDAGECIKALRAAIRIYRELREGLATESLVLRLEAEKHATEYLLEIADRIGYQG